MTAKYVPAPFQESGLGISAVEAAVLLAPVTQRGLHAEPVGFDTLFDRLYPRDP
jgi:hypothetical protein